MGKARPLACARLVERAGVSEATVRRIWRALSGPQSVRHSGKGQTSTSGAHLTVILHDALH